MGRQQPSALQFNDLPIKPTFRCARCCKGFARCCKGFARKHRLTLHLSRCDGRKASKRSASDGRKANKASATCLCDRCGKLYSRKYISKHSTSCVGAADDAVRCPHCNACLTVRQLGPHLDDCRACQGHFLSIELGCTMNEAGLPLPKPSEQAWSWLRIGQHSFPKQ